MEARRRLPRDADALARKNGTFYIFPSTARARGARREAYEALFGMPVGLNGLH